MQLIALTVLGLAAGLLIGCIGIGGVILVPALVFMGDIPIQRAIPAALLAYIVSGLVATAIFAQRKSIRWSMAVWLLPGGGTGGFRRRLGRQERQSSAIRSHDRFADDVFRHQFPAQRETR